MRGVVSQDGVPQDITDWEILCQVRKSASKDVISQGIVTKTDAVNGEYEIEVADTTLWPVATLVCDIQYTLDTDQIVSTETFNIGCVADISRAP